MRQSASRRSRRIRPTRLLLLAVRCLLLALVAIALAFPFLPEAPPEPDAVWTLIDPALFNPTLVEPALQDQLTSATAAENPVRLLEPGLPVWEPDQERAPEPAATDLWSLVREADALAPNKTRFEVVSLDRLSSLIGERPRINREVEWTSLPFSGSRRWIERAGPPAPQEENSTQAIPTWLASSDPGGLQFEERSVATSDYPNGLDLDPTSEASPPVRPLRSLTVLVAYSAERSADAERAITALQALAERAGIHQDLEIAVERWPLDEPSAATSSGPELAQLLLWLGQPLQKKQIEGRLSAEGLLLVDSLDNGLPCRRQAALPWASWEESVTLLRCEEATETPASVLWSDSLGSSLLSRQISDLDSGYRLLQFHSRFDPAWSNLTQRAAFPRLIAQLTEWASEEATAPRNVAPSLDFRAAPGQAAPMLRSAGALETTGPGSKPSGTPKPTDGPSQPDWPWWAGVAALLALERGLAGRP